jgi:hypothetical protein
VPGAIEHPSSSASGEDRVSRRALAGAVAILIAVTLAIAWFAAEDSYGKCLATAEPNVAHDNISFDLRWPPNGSAAEKHCGKQNALPSFLLV